MSIGEQMSRDIIGWSKEFQAELKNEMMSLQNQMIMDAAAGTPTAERGTLKYPPGTMKAAWGKGTLVNTDARFVTGVRNRKMPQVVHLITKPRVHYSHGKATGTLQGDDFIGRISEKYQNLLNEYIEKKLGGD